MSVVGRLLSVVVSVLVCSALVSYSSWSGAVDMRLQKTSVIAQTLRECPAWTQIPEKDVKQRLHITDVYLGVAQYDTTTIRDAISLYVNHFPASSPQYDEAGDKIFALLRVVFKVPPLVDVKKEPLPFSLLGNPVQPEGVNLLWPFSMDASGHLLLTGVDVGFHSGPAYDPLRDFDQMATRLERRFPVSR